MSHETLHITLLEKAIARLQGTKANLSDAFSESDLPYKVDVVDWASVDKWFQEIVQKDAVVISEANIKK